MSVPLIPCLFIAHGAERGTQVWVAGKFPVSWRKIVNDRFRGWEFSIARNHKEKRAVYHRAKTRIPFEVLSLYFTCRNSHYSVITSESHKYWSRSCTSPGLRILPDRLPIPCNAIMSSRPVVGIRPPSPLSGSCRRPWLVFDERFDPFRNSSNMMLLVNGGHCASISRQTRLASTAPIVRSWEPKRDSLGRFSCDIQSDWKDLAFKRTLNSPWSYLLLSFWICWPTESPSW